MAPRAYQRMAMWLWAGHSLEPSVPFDGRRLRGWWILARSAVLQAQLTALQPMAVWLSGWRISQKASPAPFDGRNQEAWKISVPSGLAVPMPMGFQQTARLWLGQAKFAPFAGRQQEAWKT